MADALRERLEKAAAGVREPTSEVRRRESDALVRKAGEHLSKGELLEARSLLDRAVHLDPSSADAHQDLGVCCARQGRLREAIACFQRALELSPDSSGVYGNLGLA